MTAKVNETATPDGFPDSSFKYTPLRHLRVVFVKFVQGLFGAAPVGSYRWVPDLDNTEIVVTDESPIQTTRLQARPGITFTRSSVQLYSAWVDDMMDFDFRTEKKTKSVLVPGTMSINCISRVDLESEQLAWVIAEHFWLLRELLMKAGFFDAARQITISAPSPAGSIVAGDQADEYFSTVVAVPFQIYRTSAFTPLGRQIVQNIELSLQTELHGPPQSGLTIPTHEFQRNETTAFPPSFAPDALDQYGRTPQPGRQVQPLPLQPHPLHPSKLVTVRTVRANRPGQR